MRVFSAFVLFVLLLSGCSHNAAKKEVVKYKSPIDSISALINGGKKEAVLFYQRGKLYAQQEKLDSAISDLEIAIGIDSTHPEYFVDLSQYYLLNAHSEKTKDILEKAEKKFPGNIPVLMELGKLYLYVEDYEKSKDYFNRILELQNDNGMAYYYKAIIAKDEKKPKNMRRFLEKTINYMPNFYEGYFTLGLSYVEDTDSLCLQYLNTAIRLKPESAEAFYAKGIYYQNAGQPLKAVRQYEFILDSIDSNYINAIYNIGYLLLTETDKYKEAEPYFSRVLHLDSARLDALYNLGLAKEMQGNLMEARKIYSSVLKKDPEFELAIEGMNRLDKKVK